MARATYEMSVACIAAKDRIKAADPVAYADSRVIRPRAPGTAQYDFWMDLSALDAVSGGYLARISVSKSDMARAAAVLLRHGVRPA